MNQLTKGKYVFFGAPEQQQGQNPLVPYFTVKGLSITEDERGLSGKVQEFEISPLLSKRSVYIDSERSLEAHKLYTWPARLGDPNAWAESKRIFFEDHLISHPIEILFELGEQEVSWQYISPDVFDQTTEQAAVSLEFKEIKASLSLKNKVST